MNQHLGRAAALLLIMGAALAPGCGGGGETSTGAGSTTTTTSGGDTTSTTGGGGGMGGDGAFPCQIRGRAGVRDTYLCYVDLPHGALISEVVAYGSDYDASSYYEGAVWRTAANSFGIDYISGYAGTWQTSGLNAINVSTVTLFNLAHAPHVVDGNYRYTIGFATKGANAFLNGFRIRYTIN